MRTHVRRWGNSLALRIPKELAREADLRTGAEVELRVVRSELIARRPTPNYRLRDLLARVTPRNRHAASWEGPALGSEIW